MNDFGPPPPANEGAGWLWTFADVVSLLLTFFVMLYSMSSVKVGQWREMADALSMRPRPSDERVTNPPTAQYNVSAVFRKRSINLEYLQAVIAEAARSDPMTRGLKMVLTGDRLVISLPAAFADDGVRPGEGVEKALFALSGLLANFTNPVVAVGHVDESTRVGASYTSKWEMSVGRAAAFANALRRYGYPHDISVQGAGGGRIHPDQGADRVDIVILSGSGGA